MDQKNEQIWLFKQGKEKGKGGARAGAVAEKKLVLWGPRKSLTLFSPVFYKTISQ